MRRDLLMLMAIGLVSYILQPAVRAEPPAAAIATKMADVTDELNRKVTGKPVQTEQKAIVSELDKLITTLEKELENGKGNMKRPGGPGMRESRISQGPGGMGTLVDPSDSAKDWGQLSQRERDRILQSMSEGFPPEYRTVLERYYRRLAEEKRSPAADGAPTAKANEVPKGMGKKS